MERKKKSIVEAFRKKTDETFRLVGGCTASEVEEIVKEHTKQKIQEYALDVGIVDVIVVGSRCRGLEGMSSDLDVVIEYSGREREDVMFDILNEDIICFGDVELDINPITKEKSGGLEEYLPEAEKYLGRKRSIMDGR